MILGVPYKSLVYCELNPKLTTVPESEGPFPPSCKTRRPFRYVGVFLDTLLSLVPYSKKGQVCRCLVRRVFS